MVQASNRKYNVMVTGKNIEVTQLIRGYIDDKITKVEVITNHIIDIHVKLDVQKLNHIVDIILKFSHFKVKVRANTTSLFSAIDKAFVRLYSKLKKWKSRIQDHHAKGVAVTEMEVNVFECMQRELNEDEAEEVDDGRSNLEQDIACPKVVKKKRRSLKILTLEEAVMKMELSDDHFLVFRSEEERELKIIYRRRDQSYGVISPE